MHTFLGSLMDGRCQQVGGVDGGTVLQDEPDTGDIPAAAGVEERCGAICCHCLCLQKNTLKYSDRAGIPFSCRQNMKMNPYESAYNADKMPGLSQG